MPSAWLRGLIAATVEKARRPDYRGCPFLNTSAEFPDPAHPARAVIASYQREVRERLLALCRAMGPRRAETLTAQFVILMNGVYAPGVALDDHEVAAVVEAAEALITPRRDRSWTPPNSPNTPDRA